MALGRIRTWQAGDVLYAADLNAEFNNILTSALNLISPLTGTLDANSQQISNIGTLHVSGVGPHAIGGGTNTRFQLNQTGTFSPAAGASSAGFKLNPTINAVADQDAYVMELGSSTIVEAASGTHALFAALALTGLAVTAGAGALTKAVGLYISAAPTGASTTYALEVASGISNFLGTVRAGVDSASPLQAAWIGTSGEARAILTVGGTATAPSGQQVYGTLIAPRLTGDPNNDAYSLRVTFDFLTAASGTHNLVATTVIEPPGLGGGSQPVTTGGSLVITGMPVFGATNYAVFSQAGNNRFDGPIVGGTSDVSYMTSGDIRVAGRLSIADGVTAPTAAVGFADIYVDSADGDLKVRFGDGTTKTLATDT